jgi:hypothetical protein
MLSTVVELSSCFGLGILGGLIASYGLRWSIARRCFRMEVALADHQKVLLSLKGEAYSANRWKKRDQELAELEAIKHTPTQRYDNDFGMRG